MSKNTRQQPSSFLKNEDIGKQLVLCRKKLFVLTFTLGEVEETMRPLFEQLLEGKHL